MIKEAEAWEPSRTSKCKPSLKKILELLKNKKSPFNRDVTPTIIINFEKFEFYDGDCHDYLVFFIIDIFAQRYIH